MRGYERHEFFNFATEQPSLKRQQMLPFYAFVGKLYTFLESVAGRLHVIWLEFFRGAFPGRRRAYIGEAVLRSRADEGDGRWPSGC
jgi:hypothetical protein